MQKFSISVLQKGWAMIKISDVIKISDRGTITIPAKYRKSLNLDGTDFIGIKVTKDGLLLRPVEVWEKHDFTKEEMTKIQKLADDKKNKGKSFSSSEEAIKHLRTL